MHVPPPLLGCVTGNRSSFRPAHTACHAPKPPTPSRRPGTREVLLSDAVLLRHRMRAGGVDASISPYEGMVRCWGGDAADRVHRP